jgi:sRNA-binding carbon storage regulator CsrA
MLALSLDVNEKIFIGEPPNQVIVQLVDVRNGTARLGFEAARHISIDRESVRKAKLENQEPPRGADAACEIAIPHMQDVKGLAGANAEHEMYLNSHKSYQAPQDDQIIRHKMEEDL